MKEELPKRKLMNFNIKSSESISFLEEKSLNSQYFDLSSYKNIKNNILLKRLHDDKLAPLGPRLCELEFGDIQVETPIFMPVGTLGSVKTLTPEDVFSLGYKVILGNTYHLFLRPGLDVMRTFGSLHNFMNWPGAILTDSGGFQVMSLAKLRKISESGVSFSNHINGHKTELNPENVVTIQKVLDSDIQMVLDECTEYPTSYELAKASMERSMRWARRARQAHQENNQYRAQFGIVQGSMFFDLRLESALSLRDLNFEGYAIGGVSVGETKKEMRDVVSLSTQVLPFDKPRYLMGVGAPEDIIDSVLLGVDMFDCVMPTRNARNGQVFVRRDESPSGKLQIKNTKYKNQSQALDRNCTCYACQNFSRAYLRHLYVSKELLALRLLSIHNLKFLQDLMSELRNSLRNGKLLDEIQKIRGIYTGLQNE